MDQVTAESVLAHLIETGTGRDRVESIDKWLKANPQATGEDLLAWAMQNAVQQGTVRKIGKVVHGPGWDLETKASFHEEITDLRGRLDEVGKLVTSLELQKAVGNKRLRTLELENRELKEQLEAARSELTDLRAYGDKAPAPKAKRGKKEMEPAAA